MQIGALRPLGTLFGALRSTDGALNTALIGRGRSFSFVAVQSAHLVVPKHGPDAEPGNRDKGLDPASIFADDAQADIHRHAAANDIRIIDSTNVITDDLFD